MDSQTPRRLIAAGFDVGSSQQAPMEISLSPSSSPPPQINSPNRAASAGPTYSSEGIPVGHVIHFQGRSRDDILEERRQTKMRRRALGDNAAEAARIRSSSESVAGVYGPLFAERNRSKSRTPLDNTPDSWTRLSVTAEHPANAGLPRAGTPPRVHGPDPQEIPPSGITHMVQQLQNSDGSYAVKSSSSAHFSVSESNLILKVNELASMLQNVSIQTQHMQTQNEIEKREREAQWAQTASTWKSQAEQMYETMTAKLAQAQLQTDAYQKQMVEANQRADNVASQAQNLIASMEQQRNSTEQNAKAQQEFIAQEMQKALDQRSTEASNLAMANQQQQQIWQQQLQECRMLC